MPSKKAQKPPSTYHAHRERQRRRILDAASKLFDERGIDRVTMAEITSASGVQPSTMYQYFSNKDDIVWAIAGRVDAGESSGAREADFDAAPNALARITALLEFMADDLVNNAGEGAIHGAVRRDVRARLAGGTPHLPGIADSSAAVSSVSPN